MTKPPARVVTALLTLAVRGVGFAGTQYSRAERFLSELALHTLDPDELGHLTCAIYDAKGTYKEETGVMPWEERWFARDLPPAPVRILVGGAGSGREVRALRAMGHEVVAFEPAPAFVRRALELDATAQLDFSQGSYEDLVEPSRARHAELNSKLERFAPYDAALVGWGSFSHVPDPDVRYGLLARFRELCPRGPILASFFMRYEPGSTEGGRLERWARGAATKARHLLDREPAKVHPGDQFLLHAGYAHCYSAQELEELADRLDACLAPADGWPHPHEYPHCTFFPGKKPRAKSSKTSGG